MTDEKKTQVNTVLRALLSALIGGLITLMLTNISQTQRNTSDIAVLKAMVEPLKDTPSQIATLQTKADRNYDLLQETYKLFMQHISESNTKKGN